MQDEDLEHAVGKMAQSPMPRIIPSSRFVRDLGEEIQRAAFQTMGYGPRGTRFEDVVIELRKLVQLLRKTLVPISPRAEFTQTLKGELTVSANQLLTTRQQRRRRWLVLGGAVGSVVSLLGLIAALLLRRRGQDLRPNKTASAP